MCNLNHPQVISKGIQRICDIPKGEIVTIPAGQAGCLLAYRPVMLDGMSALNPFEVQFYSADERPTDRLWVTGAEIQQ